MFISVSGLEETGKFATGRTEEMKQGKEATWICWEDKGNRVEVTTCFSAREVSLPATREEAGMPVLGGED